MNRQQGSRGLLGIVRAPSPNGSGAVAAGGSVPRPMDARTFLRELHAEVAANAGVGHSLLGRMDIDPRRREDFRIFSGQHYPLVGTFTRYLELLLLNAASSEAKIWLAKVLALMTKPLPNALRPMTVDQVRMLQTDNVVSEAAEREGRTLAGLGVTAAKAVAAIVPNYLERYRPRGQFSHYRG